MSVDLLCLCVRKLYGVWTEIVVTPKTLPLRKRQSVLP